MLASSLVVLLVLCGLPFVAAAAVAAEAGHRFLAVALIVCTAFATLGIVVRFCERWAEDTKFNLTFGLQTIFEVLGVFFVTAVAILGTVVHLWPTAPEVIQRTAFSSAFLMFPAHGLHCIMNGEVYWRGRTYVRAAEARSFWLLTLQLYAAGWFAIGLDLWRGR